MVLQKLISVLLMLLVIACSADSSNPEQTTTSDFVTGASVVGSPTTFTVVGDNFKFVIDGKDNPDMRVALGDTVRVELTNTHGLHDWVVDEFSAATAKIRPGNYTFVEFVADKKGIFEYYCSVGSHRANGMKGRLIVE